MSSPHFRFLVGKSYSNIEKIVPKPWYVVAVKKDGIPFVITGQYDTNRIQVEVVRDSITEVICCG